MKCKDDEPERLEKLDDIILPILLNAVNNQITIKEACNRKGISYSAFKQVQLERKKAELKQAQEIKDEIKKIANELQTKIKSYQAQH